MLSDIDKKYILKQFPKIELSYDKVNHKKVSTDYCMAIPQGRKCFAWFTCFKKKFVCILLEQGFNNKRSGDVMVELEPGWISESWKDGGTTHGSSHSYDTHVPLIFWGAKVPRKNTTKLVNVKDIAPTISSILEISFPNGCTGNPLIDITK